MKNKIIGLMNVVAIFPYYFYWGFISLFSISNRGNSMMIFYAFNFVVSSLLLLITLFKRKTLNKGIIAIICFIIFVFFSYHISNLIYGHNSIAEDTIVEFVCKPIPAIFTGIYLCKSKRYSSLSWGIDASILFFVAFCLKILVFGLLKGIPTTQWGITFSTDYQNASYIAAFCIGMVVSQLLKKNTSKTRALLYYVSIIICLLLAFYSGGRGGVVVSLVFLTFLIIYGLVSNKNNFKKRLVLVTIFIVGMFAIGYSLSNSLLFTGVERSFGFLDKGFINWENTSGRLEIYNDCLALISKKPIFGYGITGSPKNNIDRTHNIFLELLIDGGIFYFLAWLILMVCFSIFMIRNMKKNSFCIFVFLVFLGDLIMLNFSLVYMRSSGIWFALAYYLSFDSRNFYKNEYFNVNKRISLL